MRNDIVTQITSLLAPQGNVVTNARWQDLRKFPAIVVNAGNEQLEFAFTNQPYRHLEVSILVATSGVNALYDLNDKIDNVLNALIGSSLQIRSIAVRLDVQLDILLDRSDLAVAEIVVQIVGG